MHHTKLFWILIGAMAFAAVPANAQQAPAITSASAASFPAGIADSFTVTTTGVPTPAITESGTLPHGVAFVDNGDGTATLSGTAAARGSFSIGITAANGVGSNAVQDFSLSVAKSASSTGLSSSATSSTYGQSMTFTATVTSESGAPSGTVKFYDDGALLGTATLSGESAAFSTPSLNAGKHTIKATYSGSSQFASSTGSVKLTVQPATTAIAITNAAPSPSTYGQAVMFTATVSTSAGLATGNVTFSVGGRAIGSAVLSGGTASMTTTPTQLMGGTDSVTGGYAGDVNHAASSSVPYLQSVGPVATTTTIASSLNPAAIGQGVTLTATVSAATGTPSGNIQFLDGTTNLGTVAYFGGSSQLGAAFTTTGTHSLSANFLGNSTFLASSATYSETAQPAQAQGNQIQHVVIIFQENRTPDNLFHGLPGADIANSGLNSKGETIPLVMTGLENGYDLNHSYQSFLQMYDGGKMDGADLITVTCTRTPQGCPPNPQFIYVDPSQVAEYFTLAETYTFGDRMFQSNQSASFPAHQFMIAGTSTPGTIDGGIYSNYFVSTNPTPDIPTGCSYAAPTSFVTLVDPEGNQTVNIFPCFEHMTLMDLLDQAGTSWRYYAGNLNSIWTAPNAIQHLTTTPADWQNVVTPSSQVLTDIAAGNLAQVVWVIPGGLQSDHPGTQSDSGPAWVASVVNAIGSSPYWNNTAIFITWDDWGGLYDHVAPNIYNSYEYGFRVPLLVVSPYAKKGYVSHVTHDFGSILNFVETTFGLPSLGYADARADNMSDCFDFSQVPTPYVPVATKYSASYFIELEKTTPPTDPDDD